MATMVGKILKFECLRLAKNTLLKVKLIVKVGHYPGFPSLFSQNLVFPYGFLVISRPRHCIQIPFPVTNFANSRHPVVNFPQIPSPVKPLDPP